jgi:hypothetical protein
MKNKLFYVLMLINVPQRVCDHLVGENHTTSHRVFVGVIVMFVGVIFSKIHTEIYVINIVVDSTGYLLHGIGAVPIVEHISNNHENKKE